MDDMVKAIEQRQASSAWSHALASRVLIARKERLTHLRRIVLYPMVVLLCALSLNLGLTFADSEAVIWTELFESMDTHFLNTDLVAIIEN